MGKRVFVVHVESDFTVELDDRVIDVVDDEWRKSLYNLRTPEAIARHVAYNLYVNHINLSEMDGWADQPDENAQIVGQDDWELDVEEITND